MPEKIRTIYVLLMAAIIIPFGVILAAPQMIEATGTYLMNTDLDEPFAVAEDRARREAKRAAVEQSGFYLKGASNSVNGRLTSDELQVLAAQILKIQDEKVTKRVDGNNIEFTVHITAFADADTIDLEKLIENKKDWSEKVLFNQQLQSDYERIKKANAELKQKYAAAVSENERAKLKSAAIQSDRLFQANQYVERGVELYNTDHFFSAVTEYDKAIELTPDNPDLYANRGAAYLRLNNYMEAKKDLDKALRLKPDAAKIYVVYGDLYSRVGESDDAIDYYNRALQLNPNDAYVYYSRGVAYQRMKNYPGAISDFTKAISINPKYVDAYIGRAMILVYGEKNLQAATDDLNKVLSITPDNSHAKSLLGGIKIQQEMAKQAQENQEQLRKQQARRKALEAERNRHRVQF